MSANEFKDKGNEALNKGNTEEAIEFYSKAIELDSKNHILYSNRSAAYAKLSKGKQALEDADVCIKLKPDWSKGYSRKGNALEILGQIDEAEDSYEAGLKIEPDNAQLKSALEKLQASQPFSGSMDNLFSDPNLKDKLEKDPKTREYLKDPDFLLKIELLRKNPKLMGSMLNDKRMLDCLGALIGIDSSRLEVRTEDDEKSSTYKRSPSPPRASKNSSAKEQPKAETDNPNLTSDQKNALLEKEKGNEAYSKKQFDVALSHYEKAILLDPDNINFLNNKAAVFFETGDYQACIDTCQKAVSIGREKFSDFKSIARALSRIASAYYKLDDLESSKSYYEKSLVEHRVPDVVKKCQIVTKELKERQKLAYINPELAEKEKNIGNEAFQKGNYPLAMKHYTEAIARNPQDPRLYGNRAACYNKLMEFPSALKDCDESIKLDPNYLKGYLRKGAVLMAMKQTTKAADVFKEALKLDPNCEEASNGYRTALYGSMDFANDGENAKERALNDPEVQEILSDPAMQMILSQMQKDPAAVREHLRNPEIAVRLQKLMSAGVIGMR